MDRNKPGVAEQRLLSNTGLESISVDKDYSVYVLDSLNIRVMIWVKGAKEGILVADGYSNGRLFIQSYSLKIIIVAFMEKSNLLECLLFSRCAKILPTVSNQV